MSSQVCAIYNYLYGCAYVLMCVLVLSVRLCVFPGLASLLCSYTVCGYIFALLPLFGVKQFERNGERDREKRGSRGKKSRGRWSLTAS